MAGKSRELIFTLGNAEIGSILHEKYHKFLGGVYTFNSTTAASADVIRENIPD